LGQIFETSKQRLAAFLYDGLRLSKQLEEWGEAPPSSLEPSLDRIWHDVRLVHAWFWAYGRSSDIELGFELTDAHMRLHGALFRDGELYSLCSSCPTSLTGGAEMMRIHYADGTAVHGSRL
jgi:hypothetical protein